MVVNGNGELLLGRFLPDNIQVEKLFNFLGFWEFFSNWRSHDVVGDDFIAYIDTLIADVDCGSGDELFDVVLALGAERTPQDIISLVVFSQRRPPGYAN